jgi:hypothetical protein
LSRTNPALRCDFPEWVVLGNRRHNRLLTALLVSCLVVAKAYEGQTYWTPSIEEARLTLDHVDDPECSVALVLEPTEHDRVRSRHYSVVAHGLNHTRRFENQRLRNVDAGHVEGVDRLRLISMTVTEGEGEHRPTIAVIACRLTSVSLGSSTSGNSPRATEANFHESTVTGSRVLSLMC